MDLRETLANELESAEEIPKVEPTPEVVPQEGETQEQAEQRARDEKGRYAKQAPAKSLKPDGKPGIPEVKRPPRPSSWKKEYWEDFDKLDPKVADYINQREAEFSHGVSAYKTEAEQAKELQSAIAPFVGDLEQHNIHPTTWIRNLGMAHKTLVYGNPQQKLGLFAQMARDYGVPLQALLDPNIAQQYLHHPQQQAPDVRTLVHEELESRATQQEVQTFMSDSQKYPHFEKVRPAMIGLLRQEMAQDLPSAYAMAVRLDPEIFEQEQQRLATEKQHEDLRAKQDAAKRAKAHNVSLKSATPSGMNGAGKGTDLRSVLRENFDAAEDRV